MANLLRATWKAKRHWLAGGFLFATGLFVALLYLQHVNSYRGIAESKASGLAAADAAWDPVSLWKQSSILPSRQRHPRTVAMMQESAPRVRANGFVGGIVGGVPGGVAANGRVSVSEMKDDGMAERQIVRTGTLNVVAVDPASVADQVRQIAERLGGFVLNSTIKGNEHARSAAVQMRIPFAKLDEARDQIRRLAKTVEEDTVQAQDVTRQVLEQDAALRNARAEEAQYLAILKRAATVKEVMEVTEKLTEVRGDIEQKETDLRYLRHTVEMSLLMVTVNAVPRAAEQPKPQWHPLVSARLAMVDAVNALGDFADSLVSLLLYLPVIAAWVLLVFVCLKVGWWTLVRLAHWFFPTLPLWRRRTKPVQAG